MKKLDVIKITREDGQYSAITWDPNGKLQDLAIPEASISGLDALYQVRDAQQPEWVKEKAKLEEEKAQVQEQAQEAKKQLEAVRQLIPLDSLTADQIAQLVDAYPAWDVGEQVSAGSVLKYNGELWRVVQAHTTQADWTPDVVASLFTRVAPEGTIAAWEQRYSHNPYVTGDAVEYEGKFYKYTGTGTGYAYPPGTVAGAWEEFTP